MLFATILRVPTTVRVNQDILVMGGLAKVNVTKVFILVDEQGMMETKETNLNPKNVQISRGVWYSSWLWRIVVFFRRLDYAVT